MSDLREIKKAQRSLEVEASWGMKQPHYETESGFDVIDVCKAYDLNFNKGNMVKYVCRAGKKQDELTDLLKAKEYLEREIKFIREQK